VCADGRLGEQKLTTLCRRCRGFAVGSFENNPQAFQKLLARFMVGSVDCVFYPLGPQHSAERKSRIMDLFHRPPQRSDVRTGRDCRFCSQADADFAKRNPMDRLVASQLGDVASAHLTEEGHVQHRLAELRKRVRQSAPWAVLSA